MLDIEAVPGAGNLLGNLLCADANLLNGGGALSAIVNLLNEFRGLRFGPISSGCRRDAGGPRETRCTSNPAGRGSGFHRAAACR